MNQEEAAQQLALHRRSIDEIDRRIVACLNERANVVEFIGRIKQQMTMPVYEPKREDDVFRNVTENNPGPMPSDAVKRVFERIIDEMRTLQRVRMQAAKDAEKES
ncbi:MAG: chorismate mutase [Acidobacteria bacterium]|nr:chorismate mutase [Acidobacteriota bacterium]